MLFSPSSRQNNSAKNPLHGHYSWFSHLGMTLIELMVSIGITSILTTIALPNLNNFVVELRVDNEISRLSRLLIVARNHAIASQDNVIVCPLSDNGSCTSNWHEELSVFVDSNNNQRFDGNINELMVTTKRAIINGDRLVYALNRSRITYQATGHLFGLGNGTFRYCPEGHNDKSRGIVVARSGRFYATTDINNDGKDENRSRQVIQCD